MAAARWQQWAIGTAVGIGAIFGGLFLLSPLVLELNEGGVPPLDQLNLPPGATITKVNKDCGSGGCW